MSDQLGAAHDQFGYETARALFERNYQLLNEHDVRHIATIFTGRIIVNMNDVAIQIGAAPRPGTPAERLAVAMQRVNARRIARQSKA